MGVSSDVMHRLMKESSTIVVCVCGEYLNDCPVHSLGAEGFGVAAVGERQGEGDAWTLG